MSAESDMELVDETDEGSTPRTSGAFIATGLEPTSSSPPNSSPTHRQQSCSAVEYDSDEDEDIVFVCEGKMLPSTAPTEKPEQRNPFAPPPPLSAPLSLEKSDTVSSSTIEQENPQSRQRQIVETIEVVDLADSSSEDDVEEVDEIDNEDDDLHPIQVAEVLSWTLPPSEQPKAEVKKDDDLTLNLTGIDKKRAADNAVFGTVAAKKQKKDKETSGSPESLIPSAPDSPIYNASPPLLAIPDRILPPTPDFSYPKFLQEVAETYEDSLIGVSTQFGVMKEIDQKVKRVVEMYKREIDDMTSQIFAHHRVNAQNNDTYHWKMDARHRLLEIAKKVLPMQYEPKLLAVGSTVNGCGSYNSDMDLCLCLKHPTDGYDTDKDFALKMLTDVYEHFKVDHGGFILAAKRIKAVVPIVKLELGPPFDGLEIDMNCNNVAGIYNTHLMHYYAQVDVRFPALALLVKHWAIVAGICDPMNGTFNSYSLILMVIHYLQCVCQPAVLPNLQYLYPDLFSMNAPLDSLSLFQKLPKELPFRPLNEQSPAELLLGFFEYYSEFKYSEMAISIRNACAFERKLLPSETNRFRIFIEEPYDGVNTARCVTKTKKFKTIVKALKEARTKLFANPELSRIGVTVPPT